MPGVHIRPDDAAGAGIICKQRQIHCNIAHHTQVVAVAVVLGLVDQVAVD